MENLIPGMPSRSEHEEQVYFFNHVKLLTPKYPWLRTMHAIPNGGVRASKTVFRNGRQARVCAAGKKLKEEGARAGVPDIHLPVPMGKYHGLYIEAKRRPYRDGAGRVRRFYPSLDQKYWIDALQALGHRCVVCFGVDEMIATLDGYISLPEVVGVDYGYFSRSVSRIAARRSMS